MGKASSAKKLARAARAGSASKARERRDMGFPLVIGLVILLGASLVLFARSNQSAAVSPKLNVGVAGGGGGDHWHAAYGIYQCDHFIDNALTHDPNDDPIGIHSHNDGIIHIHPFVSSATGTRAQLGLFFDTEQVTFNDNELQLTDGTVLKTGDQCNGQKATLQVARFVIDKPNDPPEIFTKNLRSIRFLADREAFTIALVPIGTTIPLPPSAQNIDALSAADSGSSAAPGSTIPATTAPGDTSASTTPGSTVPGETTTTVAGASSTTSATSATTTSASSTTSATTTTTR
jgi:hypothetical protein